MFPPCVAQIHQQKDFPILETHWLALSMLMAIFARGGLGRVDGQCSNSEVSSGWCPAGSAAFASLVFFPSNASWLSPGRSTRSIACCLETVN